MRDRVIFKSKVFFPNHQTKCDGSYDGFCEEEMDLWRKSPSQPWSMMIQQGGWVTHRHSHTPHASNSATLEESNTVMCISGNWNRNDIQSNVKCRRWSKYLDCQNIRIIKWQLWSNALSFGPLGAARLCSCIINGLHYKSSGRCQLITS